MHHRSKLFAFATTLLAAGFAQGASAADLPVKAPAPVAAPFSWTGWYIGAHIGASWGTKEWDQNITVPGVAVPNIAAPATPAFTLVSDSSHTVNGIIGGGQIGFNIQNGWWLWGIELQFSGADVKGKGNCGFSALWNCSTKVDAMGTLAGRFGLVWDHVLVYVKGGGAYAHDKFHLDILGINIPGVIQPSSNSDDRFGWMVGTGVEVAITGNWSAKVEYNYMDLGTKSYIFNTTPTVPAFNNWDITERLHLVKFGLNYRFRWGDSVVARY
jgi:outer membrane immunogenic protein